MTILRNADHCHSLGAGMWDMRKSGRLVDIAIHCHGHSTRAHRIVLSVFSPVLRASLVPGHCQGHPQVMPDALPTCLSLDNAVERALDLEILLEFLYRGEVALPEAAGLQSLLRTAKCLQIDSLVEAIQLASTPAPPVEYVTIKAEPSQVHVNNAHHHGYRAKTSAKFSRKPSSPTSDEVMVDDVISNHRAMGDLRCQPCNNHSATSSSLTFYDAHSHSQPSFSTNLQDGHAAAEASAGYISDEYEASDDVYNVDDDDDAEFDFEDYGECEQEESPLVDQQQLSSSAAATGDVEAAAAGARPTKKRRFKCKQTCNKVFYSRRGYMAHIKSHAAPTRCHKCPMCAFMTGQKWTLINHLAIIHKKSTSSNKVFTVISPAVISNEKAREYLAEAETGRLDEFVNDVPAIKPSGGEILLFKTSNKTDDCNYLRDGYNFWQLGNRVTKELGLRRIYFKLHRGSRQFAEGFSRYVFKLTTPASELNQYVLVHYVGDESVYEPVSHGNTKELRIAKITTHQPGVLLKPTALNACSDHDQQQQQQPKVNKAIASTSNFTDDPHSQLPFITTMTELH